MLRNADGGGGVKFSEKLRYEGVIFNVISVTRGWVGVQFPGKKRYVTLEWPLTVNLFKFVHCLNISGRSAMDIRVVGILQIVPYSYSMVCFPMLFLFFQWLIS